MKTIMIISIVLQIIYSCLHIVDYGQTRCIAKNPEIFYEKNPTLGRHPSVKKVTIYFAVTLVLHCAISYYLTNPYRIIWQCGWIIREAYAVIRNNQKGIEVDL